MSDTPHERNPLPARQPWLLAIACAGALALLAACGSGATGTTAGSSTSPSQAQTATSSISCAQVRALRAALTNLGKIRVNANTGSQISADVTQVATALAPMKGELSSAFSVEAHLVSADLATIGKHVRALSAHPSPANLRATTTAVRQLQTAAGLAIAVMRNTCPSS